MSAGRKKVAVFLGGRSPEHDVSIVTGLQVLSAIDPELYDSFPVYVSASGEWFVGDALRDRSAYIPSAADFAKLTKVTLNIGAGAKPALVPATARLLGREAKIEFDIAIPAFHGAFGEDGCIQGMFEFASVPYTGMRVLAASVFMDKVITKQVLADTGIPLLPTRNIERPARGLLIMPEELITLLGEVSFPCIVKPRCLGSSIGISKANNWEELAAALPEVFKLDRNAIVEPFVPNLVEYNISVGRFDGVTRASAIERPKHVSELLDFKAKYLSSDGEKGGGAKQLGSVSEGMLSLTREINPHLPPEMTRNIRAWAIKAFESVGGAGAPRIDFLCNEKTGEVWLNEINPCPGSFAYFLWEAAEHPVLFTNLLEGLITEGEELHRRARAPQDPTPEAARLFKRKS
ncbi:MAG: hypothetical protein ABL864_06010 [Terricaulis sp.]|jgi:D-alanine-D-alanine ligase